MAEAIFYFWLAGATLALALWLSELLNHIRYGVLVLDQEQLPLAALQAFTVALGMAAVWPISAPLDVWRRVRTARGEPPEITLGHQEHLFEEDDAWLPPDDAEFDVVDIDKYMRPPLPSKEFYEESLTECWRAFASRLASVESELKHPCLLARTEVHLRLAQACMEQHYRAHGLDPDDPNFPFSRAVVSMTARLNSGEWAREWKEGLPGA